MTVTASTYARRANDLYETEEWATRALLRHLPPLAGLTVWEPAAGNHRIARVLTATGAHVITSDIATYDHAHDLLYDMLAPPEWAVPCDAIVTNPPYGPGNRDAALFARHSIGRCDGWVALLLTAKFDSGSTRTDLFRDNPRFAGKVVLLDRLSWTLDGVTGTEDHCWYVWRPVGQAGEPRLWYERKTT
jgi:hypothetical protein